MNIIDNISDAIVWVEIEPLYIDVNNSKWGADPIQFFNDKQGKTLISFPCNDLMNKSVFQNFMKIIKKIQNTHNVKTTIDFPIYINSEKIFSNIIINKDLAKEFLSKFDKIEFSLYSTIE